MALTSKLFEDVFLEDVDYSMPSEQAISNDEAANYARVESTDTDLPDLILAAQNSFEHYTNSLLYQRDVTAKFTAGAGNLKFDLPFKPVVSIEHVRNEDGEDLDYDLYGDWIVIDNFSDDLIEVKYTAGRYQSGQDVNPEIKIGLKKWVSSNYDDRDDTIMGTVSEMPNSSKRLWDSFKYPRL